MPDRIPLAGFAVAVALAASVTRAQFQALPPVPYPPENPITEEKRVLGKILFWDEQLSSDGTVACGTCHFPEMGGTDPREARHPGPDGMFHTADDIFGTQGVVRADQHNRFEPDPIFGFEPQQTLRNAPNFFGSLWSFEQFWDGRVSSRVFDPVDGSVAISWDGSLENQALRPPLDSIEMAHQGRTWVDVAAKLAAVTPLRLASNLPPDVATALTGGRSYPDLFQAAFGTTEITGLRIAFAIATYERTLSPDQAPFDRWVAGDPNAMTAHQVQGLNDLIGNNCTGCHIPPHFNDNQFHYLGLRPRAEDIARFTITGDPADRGAVRTPSLRNIGLQSRLSHFGSLLDVADALQFYTSATRPTRHTQFQENLDFRLRNVFLSDTELASIRDFIENGLTDPRVAAGSFPFDRPTLLSERQLDQPLPFGVDLPGTGGIAPRMIARSPLHVASPDFKFGVSHALGGSTAFVLLSYGSGAPGASFGATPIHVDLGNLIYTTAVPLAGPSGPGAGHATFGFSVVADPSLTGLVVAGQWLVLDPATPDGLSSTRGVRWRVL